MTTLHILPGPFAPLNTSWRPRRRHFRSGSNPHIYLSLDPLSPPSDPSLPIAPPNSPSLLENTSSLARIPLSPTVSTPNGSFLKPSLKSSFSSPAVPFADHPHRHAYAAPLTTPKTVKFKDREAGLESVRIYKPTGRPARLLLTSASLSDTETETETDQLFNPRSRSSSLPLPPARLEIDAARTSALPNAPPSNENICVESFALPPYHDHHPAFQGSVLVRNIAFQKLVSIRFTLDEWDTVSEVNATYSGPALYVVHTPGDAVGLAAYSATEEQRQSDSWDRFKFSIALPGDPARLSMRTLTFAARYMIDGQGEWWDNNGGANYSVHFRLALSSTVIAARSSAGSWRRRIVSAPQMRAVAQAQAVQEQAMGVFVKAVPAVAGTRGDSSVLVSNGYQ